MSDRINPYRAFTGSVVPNWLMKRKEISQGAKLLYGRLAQFAGKDDDAYPGHKRMAKELGVSDRMIRKYLNQLKEYRLIQWERKGGKDTNSYHFLSHEWQDNDRNNSSTHDRKKGSTQSGTIVPLTKDFSSGVNRNHSSYKENQYKENQEVESIKEDEVTVEKIYQAYPRKVEKKKALKSIKKALKEIGAEKLFERVVLYAKCVEGKPRKYIPHPSTWFNGGRWDDDPDEWKAWKQKSKKPLNYEKGTIEHAKSLSRRFSATEIN